jgi:WXG100 family type VII secretion target
MNYVVQAKPDDLKEISNTLKKQQENVGELQKGLVRMNDRLKQGWIGLGSEAYFAESEKLVLPAVQRLADALGEAANLINKTNDNFAQADHEASSPFQNSQTGSNTASAAGSQAPQQQGAAAAGAGAAGGQQLGSRIQNGGFGTAAHDAPLRAADLGSSVGAHASMGSPNDWLSRVRSSEPFRLPNDSFRSPSDWSSSLGDGLGSSSDWGGSGGGGGGGSGSGGGGAGSMGSIFGALRGQAGTGFGLGGSVGGGAPELSYSGMGGFGGAAGSRPLDFAVPLAIAGLSPLAAVLGKVVKDRTQNNN